jgi:Protein of unknown function (DUF3306)
MTRPEDDAAEGGFLARWTRRKQEAKAAPAQTPDAPQEAPSATPATPQAAGAEAMELPLPSLDDVVAGGDVSVFLQAHVPESLRNAALRKLWTTDPAIRDFIEMADYQWNFNDPDSIPGWSSTLPGVDVQALARRIFGEAEPKAEAEEPAIVADAPPVEAAAEGGDIAAAESPPAAIQTIEANGGMAADPLPAAPVHPAADEDCAVQNTAAESYTYVGARKRHGGALPT